MFIAYDRGLRGTHIFFVMKKLSFYFSLLAIAAMAVAATSCTKEEIGSPGTDPGSDPTVQVPDPEGTITLSMRNDRGTYLDDNFYIDDADNFSGGYFVSLGEMKGLGNVTRIPKHGWSSKTAVVPGTGYVAYNSYGRFYRLFVTSYTVNTMNEIIGADVKYQTPFYPTETIKLPLQVLEFGQAGGSQNIVFGNENIIPFKVSSSADWCQVYTSSTLNYSFLTDGIIVEVTPNEGAQREATVSILDGNNNVQEISIIQAGAEPYLTLSQDTLSLPYTAGNVRSLGVMTNYYFDDLTITSSAEWCQATLESNGGDMLARMNEQVRFKGKERITDKSNYGTSSYTLSVSASSDNDGETPREATVTVASKDGSNKAELKVKQERFDIVLSAEEVQFERTPSYHIVNTGNTTGDYTVTSSADWCSYSWSGSDLVVRVFPNETGEDRVAELTVSIANRSKTITVYQSRYAIGDAYSVDGVEGTVGILTGQNHGKIYCELPNKYVWSIEEVLTGANSTTDGEYNMNVILQIPGYETLYPAFKAVADLNVNGITGWYIPAIDELTTVVNNSNSNYWSSTEYESNTAYYYSSFYYGASISFKHNNSYIIAMKKF